jgi:lysine-ketoglutarate reductase/saccharopine dehydrogenase-like protein (TIGR00300 family)
VKTEDRGPKNEAGSLRYAAPDFTAPRLAGAPPARTVAAESDGVLPDGFFATTNLPTYVKSADGQWSLPHEPRMDGCIVAAEGGWWVREGRRVRRGDRVVIGRAEDGSEGVLVHAHGFQVPAGAQGDFHFMSSQVSREKPIDYGQIARMLVDERARGGRVIWVTGPALVHSRARDNFVWFIRNGFVQALLAGNAVGAHDIESAVVGTTLGMTDAGEPTEGGHAAHMRAINAIRRVGSIANAVRDGIIQNGIMHACVVEGVPFVLCGSIRDDGPLPGVITDSIAAQDAMRAHTIGATMAVMIATALHSIAVGNMLPAYYEDPVRGIVELPTICVDASEFLVSKLKDRGTHQAVGVVTNAQDFMSIIRSAVEAEILKRDYPAAARSRG